jgi:hypothetical protein
MEPVIVRSIDMGNDAADGGVWPRVQASRSPTLFIPNASHARDRAFAILGAVKEVAARVVLGHDEQ